jgi:hypothetical protein
MQISISPSVSEYLFIIIWNQIKAKYWEGFEQRDGGVWLTSCKFIGRCGGGDTKEETTAIIQAAHDGGRVLAMSWR